MPPAALTKTSPSKAPTRRAQSEASISMRVSLPTLGLIDSAAAAVGKSRTEFVLESARREATDVLLDQRLFGLDEHQHAAFMHALDHPPPANEKLRELMAKPSPWET